MSDSRTTPRETAIDDDIDVEALRAKYAAERDRRIRPDGATQYRKTKGEWGYYARDPYTERQEREPRTDDVEALIIGTGIGGLSAAARLREKGVESIRIMDDAGDVGGTWYWNRYPNVHCDVESYVYMPFLETIGYIPKWRYAPGEEIRQGLTKVAQHFDLYRDALFHTKATSLDWDEETQRWQVTTDRGDRFQARFVIIGTGSFTDPKLPGIPGIEDYKGHTFHTARWDYGYTGGDQFGGLTGLADKRVAVVGTGATGVQLVPMLAKYAKELLVFQRTPSSIGIRGNGPTDPEWAASLKPGWQEERARNFAAVLAGERLVGEQVVEDDWVRTARAQRPMTSGRFLDDEPGLSPEELERRIELDDFRTTNWMRARIDEIVDDPATAEALKPWYRYMCKRPAFSDEYLQAFNLPNVRLVDTSTAGGITRMTENAVVVGDEEYEVDCVIFATGFDFGVSGLMSGELPTTGRNGKQLLEVWMTGPRTLHGCAMDDFPNLFNMGLLQNASSVNLSYMLQTQAQHVAAIIDRARQTGAKRIEASKESVDAWLRLLRETGRDNTRYSEECTPGYYNREGNARSNVGMTFSPGPIAFWEILEEWRAGDMSDVLVPADADARESAAPARTSG